MAVPIARFLILTMLTLLAPAMISGAALPAYAQSSNPVASSDTAYDEELRRRFQYPPPESLPEIVEDEAKGRQLDAIYFRSFVDYDRSYSDAARAKAKGEVERLIQEAAGLTREEFVLRIAAITALADNAHTAISDDAFSKNTPRIPLRTYLFADGLYVLRAPGDFVEFLGSEVTHIEGVSIEDLLARLRSYVGGVESRRRMLLVPLLESPNLLAAAGIGEWDGALDLTLRLADGRTVERRVEGEERGPAAPVMSTARLLFPATPGRAISSFLKDEDDIPKYLENRTELFTASPLPFDGFYIGLDHNADGDEAPLQPFLKEVLERVRTSRPSYVVLDMRMNQGGDYTKTYAFARALPAAVPQARIYALTSPWTFSAAITTVAALEDEGEDRVTIVGESAGDRLDFWAEGGTFRLPNTLIGAHYSAGRHNYQGECTDRDTCFWLNERYPVRVASIEPDIAAPLTFAAYRAKRDPAMDAILTRESRSRSTRKTDAEHAE